MTFRHLKIFIAVCDTMNMTAAAKALYMSQPAVSQAIAELENYYELRLFERLSRKLYLTKAGEKLLSYARHMVKMGLDAESDMKAMQEHGSIRIGSSVTIAANVLPKMASNYSLAYPHTRIEVFEDNTEKIEKLILSDEIDVALVEGEIQSSDINSQAFLEDELVLICSSNHRFANYEIISPKDLEMEKFIVREKGSGTRKLFEDIMAANQLNWTPIWTCSNADTIKMAAREGLGISVISWRAVIDEVKSGYLCQKRIRGLQFKRQFKIAHHKNKFITRPMEQFINLCNSTADLM